MFHFSELDVSGFWHIISKSNISVNYLLTLVEIPHEKKFVAEVPGLQVFDYLEQSEFWQIRLHEPHYFFTKIV
jgi:hypothetical protein